MIKKKMKKRRNNKHMCSTIVLLKILVNIQLKFDMFNIMQLPDVHVGINIFFIQ